MHHLMDRQERHDQVPVVGRWTVQIVDVDVVAEEA